MKQTFFTRHKFNKCTVRHNRFYFRRIGFANFRNCNNAFNLSNGSIDCSFIVSRNFHTSLIANFFNGNHCTGFSLHILNNFSTRSDYRTNHFFRNVHGHDTWSIWFHIFTWSSQCFLNFTQNMHTSGFRLFQCSFQNFVRKSVNLDIHLSSRDTIFCSGYLEVHIAQVIFITQNIRKNSKVFTFIFRNQSHGNTRNWFLNLYTCIHQRQCSGTNRSH